MILITNETIGIGDYIINTKLPNEILMCIDILNDGVIWSSIDGRSCGYEDISIFKRVLYNDNLIGEAYHPN